MINLLLQGPRFKRSDSSLRRFESKDLRLEFESQYNFNLRILKHRLFNKSAFEF